MGEVNNEDVQCIYQDLSFPQESLVVWEMEKILKPYINRKKEKCTG